MSECKDLLGEAQNCLAAAVVALLKAPPPSVPAAGLSALRVAPRCLLGFQDHCDKDLMHTQVARESVHLFRITITQSHTFCNFAVGVSENSFGQLRPGLFQASY